MANQVWHFIVEITNFRSLFKPWIHYKFASPAMHDISCNNRIINLRRFIHISGFKQYQNIKWLWMCNGYKYNSTNSYGGLKVVCCSVQVKCWCESCEEASQNHNVQKTSSQTHLSECTSIFGHTKAIALYCVAEWYTITHILLALRVHSPKN